MKYGLVGEKLGHSFSKEIHGMLGSYEYELFEVPREEFDDFIRKREFFGINITIPYKSRVMPLLDAISPEAQRIGAVNTVINDGGRLIGYNTDFAGMREMLLQAEIPVRENTVLILGTGGTSSTAEAVCISLGAKKTIRVSRSPLGCEISYPQAKDDFCSEPLVIVNTTPCGMFPDDDGIPPIDVGNFYKLRGVADVIYNPLRTKLLTKAKKLGIPAVGGLYMLTAQAVYASELFCGKKYPAETVRKVYREILFRKTDVVLTGMPSCGKTTVGRLLSEKLGKTFIDADEEFTKANGLSPAGFISRFGEEKFRENEAGIIAEIAKKTGCVIATGGGTVLRAENIEALRRNGKIFFIDRPYRDLIPTGDRPLSSTPEQLKRRYAERYPIYKGTADCTVDGAGTPGEVVDRIYTAMRWT